ncbi:MAG TPA: S8 family serine peptidase [Thermoanaerobaculia bacterium]
MRLRSWCCAAVILQSTLVFGAPSSRTTVAGGGSELAPAFGTPGETVDVIVQFRDEPLFARGRTRIASDAAIRSFDERFATFERDLARIQRGIASNARSSTPVRITARYSRTFAGAAITIGGDALDRVAALDYVRSIHVDRPVQAFLDRSVPKIRAPQVWSAYGTRGKDVVVAVIDTGIDYNHPAFGGGFGPGHRVAGGWDFVNNDADPLDDAGHGTHVAGIVGGNGGGVVGVAPEVTFLAIKVLNAQGNGSSSGVLSGIERAADPNDDGNPEDHADIANVSLGAPGTPDDPVSRAVETATNAGVIFCIATGNAGAFQTVSSPGNAPSAISVGATTLDDEIAGFSSKGPVSGTLAIKPEVVAPGVGIVSAQAGGGTLAANGTSMAAPHVAGVAALLRAVHPDWTPADIKAAIVGTAERLTDDVMATGAGRVDALRAARADVVAHPSTLSLGRDDVTQSRWSVAKTLTLSNHGPSTRTLTLQASSPHPHIAVTLSTSTATLAAGETREIGITFEVDNAKVESPREGSLAISGAVTITGGAMPLHVPWAFVKAAVVTVTYDADNPFEAFVASTNSLAHARILVDPYQRTGTGTVPAGEYDIKVVPFPMRDADLNQRLIVVERQTVENAATFALRRDMAPHAVISAAKDERGVPLANIARGNGSCQQTLILVWPEGGALALSSMSLGGEEGVLVSPLSERFVLLPFQRCIDYGRVAAYSAQLEPIRGLTGPVTRTLEPAAWARNPLRITIPPDAVAPSIGVSVAWMWHGANWTFVESMGGRFPANGGVWNGTAFVTRELHPTIKAIMNAQVEMDVPRDGPPAPFPRAAGLRTPPVRLNSDGTWIWPYLTKAPTTYVAAPEEVLPFGAGLAHPQTTHWVQDGELLTGTRFHGSLDEERDAEAIGSNVVLRDEAGNVVRSGKIFIPPFQITPGAYQFELSKPHAIAGVLGEVRLLAAFDTRRTDGAPPSLTALRLLGGNGRIASSLGVHEAGALLFSAIDRVPVERGAQRGPVVAETVRLRWKVHGTAEWRTLPLTIVGHEIANGQAEFDALGHIPVGTAFRADLAPITAAGAALIDLSLTVHDPSGNTYDYTMAPAFAVRGERRRTIRH